jgi:hypothetical protein
MATLKASLIANIIGIEGWLLRLTQVMGPEHP